MTVPHEETFPHAEKEEEMNITKKLNDSVLEIALEGRLDTSSAPSLESELKSSLQDIDYLIFDFAKLDYISSAGLRVLLSANKEMLRNGKAPVSITNANDIVREVFEVTGFSEILNIA